MRTLITRIRCDRCKGAHTEMKTGAPDPPGWVTIRIDGWEDRDICPSCRAVFHQVYDDFLMARDPEL